MVCRGEDICDGLRGRRQTRKMRTFRTQRRSDSFEKRESNRVFCVWISIHQSGENDTCKNKYFQFSSVAQSCPTLCNPMNRSTPGLPVHHQLTQTHVHRVSDAILCHPLLLLPPNPFQHQCLFQQINSLHEVAKVLEFQLQHQSFQWIPRTGLL